MEFLLPKDKDWNIDIVHHKLTHLSDGYFLNIKYQVYPYPNEN